MDSREAFKLGFLLRCAEAGTPPAEAILAADELTKQADGWAKAIAGPLFSTGTTLGAVGLIGGPAALGAAGGYALHKATDKPMDEDDVKQTELSDEYRRLARVARLNATLRNLRSRASQL